MRNKQSLCEIWESHHHTGICGTTNLRNPEYTGICDGRPGDEPRFGSGELSTSLLRARITVIEQKIATSCKGRKHNGNTERYSKYTINPIYYYIWSYKFLMVICFTALLLNEKVMNMIKYRNDPKFSDR